jgi:hypothetical protein
MWHSPTVLKAGIASDMAGDILTRFYPAFTAMADTFTSLSTQGDPAA